MLTQICFSNKVLAKCYNAFFIGKAFEDSMMHSCANFT
jgi:hypothetical protein